jgi:putative endonuclease
MPVEWPGEAESVADRRTFPAMAYVYLLRCGDDSLYCGWTVDLDARVAAHDAGRGARYTRGRGPVRLAAAWAVADRRAAQALEVRVKRLSRAAKEALVAGAPLDGARRVNDPAAQAQ